MNPIAITCIAIGVALLTLILILDKKLSGKVHDMFIVGFLMFFVNAFFWMMDRLESKRRRIQYNSQLRRIMYNDAIAIHKRIDLVSTQDDYEDVSHDIDVFEMKYNKIRDSKRLAQGMVYGLAEKAQESLFLVGKTKIITNKKIG